MAEMPFAVDGGGVAASFAQLGERHFVVADAGLRLRAERAEDADALGIAAGHQAGPRGGADGGGGMEIGEDAAFLCHAVEVGRFVGGRAERADVGVAHVVDEDDDDVGRVTWRLSP